MKRVGALATVAVACAFFLAGCGNGDIVDVVEVNNVPACRTWPVELAGDTYWELDPAQIDEWIETHEDPYGGTPQPQASAAWPDGASDSGWLYRYDDGTALFISETGERIYFGDQEREFDAVC